MSSRGPAVTRDGPTDGDVHVAVEAGQDAWRELRQLLSTGLSSHVGRTPVVDAAVEPDDDMLADDRLEKVRGRARRARGLLCLDRRVDLDRLRLVSVL